MIRTVATRISLAIVLSAFVSGCSNGGEGTTSGNPYVNFSMNGSSRAASLAFNKMKWWIYDVFFPKAYAVAPPSLEDSNGSTIVLTEFWTTIGEIEFKPTESADSGEVDGEEIEFEGPFSVDLLADGATRLGSGSVSNSGIRRVKYKLSRTEDLPSGAPAQFSDQSIFIEGTVGGVAFDFSTQEETEVEVAGPNLVALSDGDDLLLQIQIANIFKKTDMSSIGSPTSISQSNRVSATNPCPLIDASASDLYTCFRKGIEAQANFGKDNGDDELTDDDETVK